MTQVEHFTPQSLEEAVTLLSKYGENAAVIAGSTDLLVRMKKGEDLPGFIISIDGLQDLDYIRDDKKGGLKIGARTTMHSIVGSPLIRERCSVVASAAGMVGTPTIRRQATIGGNLCNAAPSADTAPALFVLGAHLKIQGGGGERIVPVEDFFTGPGRTVLGPNEILAEIQIPAPAPGSKTVYLKQTRTRGADLALVGVAAMAVMEGGVVKDVKIALGAVAPTPIRARAAEEILRGKKAHDSLLTECAEAGLKESSPIDDVRASADYRKKLIRVLVKRAVGEVM